jgi:hypothetical protein
MNPFVNWFVAHTVARRRARQCPRCRHSQIVSAARARETVACERCKSPIPPPQQPRR